MIDDFLEKSEPRTLGLLLGGVAVLLITVLVMHLLWPQVQRYRDSQETLQMLAQTQPGKGGIQQQLEQVRGEVADLSRQLHGDMAGLPAKQMESFIIGRLQAISWDNGIRLVSVKPGVGESIQDFQERLFEIQLQARYHDFHRWLQAIGRDLGFIVVQKFQINPREQKESDPELDIRLTIVSYHMVRDA